MSHGTFGQRLDPPPEPGVAFHDLDREAFPFTAQFIRTDTGEVLETLTVTGPGAVQIRPWGRITGAPIRVRTTYADGTVDVVEPPGAGPGGS